MKVVINKNTLESVINNTKSYLEKKDISSTSSHIYIYAKDSELNIKATDYEIGLSYKLKNVQIQQEGYATANGNKISEIMKILKNEEPVTLETVENYLYIKQKNSKYKLPMYKQDDFPTFPKIENKKKFEIDSSILVRGLKKILPTIPTNNPKYEMNGASLDIKTDHINVVGTDSKRLGIFKIDKQTNEEFSMIIPKKAIFEMQKLLIENVEIYYDQNTLIAISKNYEFFTKLINGKYPNYAGAVPKETKYKIKLNRDQIIDGIKSISILSENIQMTIGKNSITFEGILEDSIEAKTNIETNIEIEEDIILKFKSRNLLDFLTSIEESEFELSHTPQTKSFLVESQDFKTVIMIVNI